MKLALACLLVACNQVYDLDPTRTVDAYSLQDDPDRDGIATTRDNCPTVANIDQLDADGDGRGDVCDGCDRCEPCDRGPDHDEDNDKIPDGCDPCPAYDEHTDDTDRDGVGDACDGEGIAKIFLFDGFASLAPTWLEDGTRWTADGDRARPDPDLPSSPYGLQYQPTDDSPVGPSGEQWYIEVGITPPPVVSNNIGIEPNPGFYCYLQQHEEGQFRLYLNGSVSPDVSSLPPVVILRLVATGQNPAYRCELDGIGQPAISNNPIATPATVRLHANRPDNVFTYVLVAE